MIIKSMARKEPTFTQLYDYITREGDYAPEYCFTRNFILRDREAILNEFERNATLLRKRKNGNYLYHEIISITRAKGISQEEQKEQLLKIVQQYAESRAKDCLVFGGLHVEKDNNLHFHLMVSANKLNQSKRYRLSKQQFSEIKIGLETHVLEHHPELEQAKLISAEKRQGAKTSNREQALKRRTGKPTQKDLFKEKLQGIFEKSVDKSDFFDNLESADIECYTRGKTIGFLDRDNGKKHRLKTLGLEAEFEATHNKIKDAKITEKPKQESRSKRKPSSETPDLGSTDEWLKGDFKNREKQTLKKKWRSQDRKDKQVKNRGDQTQSENIKETASEWVFGDFSKRDARTRQEKSKERLAEYRKQLDEKQTKGLTKKEIFKRQEEIRDQRAKQNEQADQQKSDSSHKPKPE